MRKVCRGSRLFQVGCVLSRQFARGSEPVARHLTQPVEVTVLYGHRMSWIRCPFFSQCNVMQQLCYSCSCAMWPAAQQSGCIVIPTGSLLETAYSFYHHRLTSACCTMSHILYGTGWCSTTSRFGHISGCNDSNSTTCSCDNSNGVKGSSSIYWRHTATMRAVCSFVMGLRWGHHQPAGGVCLFTTLFPLSPAVQFAGFCVLCAAMHSLRCVLSQDISHHVICDVSHATLILFLPNIGHMNAGPYYMLQCIYVHTL